MNYQSYFSFKTVVDLTWFDLQYADSNSLVEGGIYLSAFFNEDRYHSLQVL